MLNREQFINVLMNEFELKPDLDYWLLIQNLEDYKFQMECSPAKLTANDKTNLKTAKNQADKLVKYFKNVPDELINSFNPYLLDLRGLENLSNTINKVELDIEQLPALAGRPNADIKNGLINEIIKLYVKATGKKPTSTTCKNRPTAAMTFSLQIIKYLGLSQSISFDNVKKAIDKYNAS
jgi:hypothetical protein